MLHTDNALLNLRLAGLSRSKEIAKENGDTPLFVWILLVLGLGLFVALVIWLYRRSRIAAAPTHSEEQEIELPPQPAGGPVRIGEPEPVAVVSPRPEPPTIAELVDVPPVVTAAGQADDLVRIEGIGPRIASILRAAGISTFAQLAATDVSRLRELMVAARLPFIDPETWPEQARLAAAGDWTGFEALTRELRGGRRAL